MKKITTLLLCLVSTINAMEHREFISQRDDLTKELMKLPRERLTPIEQSRLEAEQEALLRQLGKLNLNNSKTTTVLKESDEPAVVSLQCLKLQIVVKRLQESPIYPHRFKRGQLTSTPARAASYPSMATEIEEEEEELARAFAPKKSTATRRASSCPEPEKAPRTATPFSYIMETPGTIAIHSISESPENYLIDNFDQKKQHLT